MTDALFCNRSDWKRSISSWCNEVDVALLDATFHGKGELKGRDMSEVVQYDACFCQEPTPVILACRLCLPLWRAGGTACM